MSHCGQSGISPQQLRPLNFWVRTVHTEFMSKARKAFGIGAYPGPTVGMEIDPDELLRQLAYGSRKPMLRPRQRINGLFFARLLDEMSQHHTVLVRTTLSASGAHRLARRLREELPSDAFGIHVDYVPRLEEWNVLVFHQIPREMRVPRRRDEDGNVWIGTQEVARVLKLSRFQARRVIDSAPVETRRVGGRSERQIRQRDLAILANRPRRWRHRTRGAA